MLRRCVNYLDCDRRTLNRGLCDVCRRLKPVKKKGGKIHGYLSPEETNIRICQDPRKERP